MKVVILAGGYGTRITEESQYRPKPMIEIGGKPILWHIMKLFSHYGFNDFVICAGYRQDVIKKYFFDYYIHNSDVTFDLITNSMKVHTTHSEPWKVSVIDTGLETMTGGRIKRISEYVENGTFLLTYGDGVSNIDIKELVSAHKKSGKAMTISSYNVGQQFGVLDVDEQGNVNGFREKDDKDGSLINIGYMVCEPEVFKYIEGDSSVFEKAPLENLAKDGRLFSREHHGFWKCMDTIRDKNQLEELWESGKAPWKVWKD